MSEQCRSACLKTSYMKNEDLKGHEGLGLAAACGGRLIGETPKE